jgi:fumarylpyruvate hydrolase
MNYVFPPALVASVAVVGTDHRFPVHRIYCIGRNYADHAKEMGSVADRANPVFFCKPADAVVADRTNIVYPSATTNLHHEVEMVVALQSGGTQIPVAQALRHVYGYAVGVDLTRRDLQNTAKAKGMPWDASKAFDRSAPISAIRRVSESGHPEHAMLSLEVNGAVRQNVDISQMLMSVPEIINELSKLFELHAGDLIFTGTPAGVAALNPGDRFHARLDGIGELRGAMA